jgi:hypothetical protein
MKVYDLISILERLDPQADITVWNDGFQERTKDVVVSRVSANEFHIDCVLMGTELKVDG